MQQKEREQQGRLHTKAYHEGQVPVTRGDFLFFRFLCLDSVCVILASKRPHLSNPMCSEAEHGGGGWKYKCRLRRCRTGSIGAYLLILHSSCSLMCGIFEADVLLHILIPMFRFAAHGVTEVQPLRGYAHCDVNHKPAVYNPQTRHLRVVNTALTHRKRCSYDPQPIRLELPNAPFRRSNRPLLKMNVPSFPLKIPLQECFYVLRILLWMVYV